MGNGASSLTVEQQVTVTKALKEKLATLSSDLSDGDANEELTKRYKELVDSFIQPQPKKCAPGFMEQLFPQIVVKPIERQRTLTRRMSASSTSLRSENGLPRYAQPITRRSIDLTVKVEANSGRRRSFAVNPVTAKRRASVAKIDSEAAAKARAALSTESPTPSSPTAGGVTGTIADAIAAATSAVEDLSQPVDSWESVTQQPYCALCQMTFKSMPFLDRHTKYSDLHARNLKKSTGADGGSGDTASSTADPAALSKPSVQVEGVHYQLYYHGSKFFWKQQKSIDFDIYFHILANVFEVVAFDVEKHRELARLYLDGVSVEQIVEPALREAVEERKRDISKDRFAEIPSDQTLRGELKRNLMTSHILQRLQLHSDIANKLFEVGLVFVLNSDDSCVQNPCMDKPPSVVVPVASIARRRKSTTSEINNAIAGLRSNSAEVSEYLNTATMLMQHQPASQFEARADSIAKIVFDVATYLRTPKWYSTLNRVRQRWIRAVRTVIRRSHVAKIQALLDSRDLRKQMNRAKSLRRGQSTRAREF